MPLFCSSARLQRAFWAAALALFGCGSEAAKAAPADPNAACEQGEREAERHGTDCFCCHVEEFSVAGSVAPGAAEGVVIEVLDARGQRLVMPPNPYDNFFQHTQVAAPLRAQVTFANGDVRAMKADAPHGSCNRCHGKGDLGLIDATAR